MRLSCVVLSYNSTRYLDDCIRSLAAWVGSSGAQDEILIVENGSRDGSAELVRSLESEFAGVVRGIYLDRNVGTTRSRNLAAAEARGRFLAFIDSDVQVRDNVFDPLISHLVADSSCGIACPRLTYPSGNFQLSFDVFPTLQRKVARFFALRRMEREAARRLDVEQPVRVDYCVSAFWLMTQETFELVGGFDEEIFYAPEDVDFCIRVWKAGKYVLYDPRAVVIHDAQEISRGIPLKRSSFSHLRGLIYLFRKHGYLFSTRGLRRAGP